MSSIDVAPVLDPPAAGLDAAPAVGRWRQAARKLKRRPAALFGLAVVVFFVLLALLAPWLSPYDPIATSWSAIRKPPSAEHWFGTDDIGRDVLARVVWGTRASLAAGVISVSISLAIGVPIGLAAGFIGGFTDGLISRITDAFLACPFLILAIAMAAFLGPSLTNAMIAIGVSATPIFVRLTRAQVINVKVEDYVEAARALGNPPWRIAIRHVLPNVVPPLIVQTTLAISGGDHRRGEPVVPWPRPAAPGAELGQHAQHRQELHGPGAVDGDLARARDLRAGAGVQPAGRWAAGCARSAAAVVRCSFATVLGIGGFLRHAGWLAGS